MVLYLIEGNLFSKKKISWVTKKVYILDDPVYREVPDPDPAQAGRPQDERVLRCRQASHRVQVTWL